MKIPIAILKNIKCNDSYINFNTTKEYKTTWQSFNLMYNAKSSAGFRTSAMSKVSTTLDNAREYNTCIVQRKSIIKETQEQCWILIFIDVKSQHYSWLYMRLQYLYRILIFDAVKWSQDGVFGSHKWNHRIEELCCFFVVLQRRHKGSTALQYKIRVKMKLQYLNTTLI
jgi:hypothetical protein